MVVVKAMIVFIVVKCLMFNGICIKFYGFLKFFNMVYCTPKCSYQCVDMCDVYVQDMLIGGIGTLHYHFSIIYF
jgi:hypothetical protein